MINGVYPWSKGKKTIHKVLNNYGDFFQVNLDDIGDNTLEVKIKCLKSKDCKQEFKLISYNEDDDFTNIV